MSSISQFNEGVISEFGFLERDLGFRCIVAEGKDTLDMVRFEKAAITVLVGWYKGEVDVLIRVAVDTSILRPYRRKAFHVGEIAKHLQPDVFSNRPALPGVAISIADAMLYVRFYAGLLKDHCQQILQGDVKTLEEILQKEKE